MGSRTKSSDWKTPDPDPADSTKRRHLSVRIRLNYKDNDFCTESVYGGLMKQLTGEVFHLCDGRLILVHNEQRTNAKIGDQIVFDKRIYRIDGVIPPSAKPESKWSIVIKEDNSDGSEARLCKCFSPPDGSPCIKDEVYKWTWCIDGKTVFLDSGKEWCEGDFEFFRHFSVLTGWR